MTIIENSHFYDIVEKFIMVGPTYYVVLWVTSHKRSNLLLHTFKRANNVGRPLSMQYGENVKKREEQHEREEKMN